MNIYISKTTLHLLAITIAFAGLVHYGFTYADSWTAPAVLPPANNVDTPINTGASPQFKDGNLVVGGEQVGTLASGLGQFRMVHGTGGVGTILRNDGLNTYFLLTASGHPLEYWRDDLRPFVIDNNTGGVYIGNGLGVNGEMNVSNGTIHVNTGSVEVAQHVTAGAFIWSPQIRADQFCDGGGNNCITTAPKYYHNVLYASAQVWIGGTDNNPGYSAVVPKSDWSYCFLSGERQDTIHETYTGNGSCQINDVGWGWQLVATVNDVRVHAECWASCIHS